MPTFGVIVVDVSKLRDYCLSPAHQRGRHKARVFHARLGLAAADAELLRDALLRAARERSSDMRLTETDSFGQRYALDFEMKTAKGTGTVRSVWIAASGEDVLRFVTCYLLRGRRR